MQEVLTFMTISITASANQRMRQFLAQTPAAAGVRFGVKRTGCSGFVIVDTKSLPLVEGTVIDFQRQGLNASFVFHNPNATGECGCGESFTVG
jgi:iron-sulfur cluster assembly protein